LAVEQVPMVVFYRLPWLLRVLRRVYLLSPWFALCNVVAGRRVVEERLVGGGAGARLGDEVADLLLDPARWAAVRASLGVVRERLVLPGVADRAACAVLEAPPAPAPARRYAPEAAA
jgi:lipid A disaccharide synthetase